MSSMKSEFPINIEGVKFNLSIDVSKLDSDEGVELTQLPGSEKKWDNQKITALKTAFQKAIADVPPKEILHLEGIKKGLGAINATLLASEPKIQAAAASGFRRVPSKEASPKEASGKAANAATVKPVAAKPMMGAAPSLNGANRVVEEAQKALFRPISPPTFFSEEFQSGSHPASPAPSPSPVPTPTPSPTPPYSPPPSPNAQVLSASPPPSPSPAPGVVSPSSAPDVVTGITAQPKKFSDSELINIVREEGQKYGGVDRLEQLWYPPRGFASVDAEAIAKCLRADNLPDAKIQEYLRKLPNLTLKQYVESVGLKNTSGSCGNTTNALEDLIHPLGDRRKDVEPVETRHADNVDQLIAALDHQMRTNQSANWFTRVDVGGHSFLIEFSKGKYRIHQSFWGSTTLAINMEKNTTWTVKEFYDNLKLALAVDEGPKNVAARKFLFASPAVHPKPGGFPYRVIDKPVSPQVLTGRLASLTTRMAAEWHENENKPMSQFLVTRGNETLTQEVFEYNRTGKNSVETLIEHESIMDWNERDVPGTLDEFEKAVHDDHSFKLTRDSLKGIYKVETTPTGYRFVLQKQ